MTTWLVAAGLIALPILIHLFNRTRYRKIQWAAMDFLLAAYKKTRRRVQVEHLLLLLLRVMAMLFLAFAFFPDAVANAATSVLNATGISFVEGTNAGKARHVIIVLDDTFSMQYEDANTSKSSFERSRDYLAARMQHLRENRDQVTIIPVTNVGVLTGDIAKDQEAYTRLNREIQATSVERASDSIVKLTPGYGSGNMLSALREAGRRAAATDPENMMPFVEIISDFQGNQWSFLKEGDPESDAFTTLIQDIDSVVTQGGGRLRMQDVGAPNAVNFAVTDVRLTAPVIGVNIPARVQVTVANTAGGDGRSETISLQYRVNDGEAIRFDGRNRVNLAPGESRTVEQAIGAFTSVGTRTLQVEIVNQDTLKGDNRRSVAIKVIDELPILVVNGVPSQNPAADEINALMKVLEIDVGSGPDAGRVTPKRIEVKTVGDLSTSPPLDSYAIVILANVGDVPPQFVERLEEYVGRIGGTLFLGLGQTTDIAKYNSLFFKDGQGLLPARLDRLGGVAGGNISDAQLYGMVAKGISAGSLLEDFGADQSGVGLLERDQAMRTWIETTLPQDIEELRGVVPAANVSLAVANEQESSLLLDREFGSGRVVMWTSTLGNRWHDYWASQTLPLIYVIHDVVKKTSITAGAPRLNVGEHFVRLLPEDEQTARGNDVMTPSGDVAKPIETSLADGRRRVSFTQTSEPGIYNLRFLILDETGNESVAREEAFTVGIPASESNVQRIDTGTEGDSSVAAVLQEQLTNLGSLFVGESLEENADQEDSGPRAADKMDLWILFVGLALLMLLGEMGVSLWFNRASE